MRNSPTVQETSKTSDIGLSKTNNKIGNLGRRENPAPGSWSKSLILPNLPFLVCSDRLANSQWLRLINRKLQPQEDYFASQKLSMSNYTTDDYITSFLKSYYLMFDLVFSLFSLISKVQFLQKYIIALPLNVL